MSRRDKAAADKEYHDFLHGVENAAKRILKDATRRKIEASTQARVLALRRKRQRPGRGEPGRSAQSREEAQQPIVGAQVPATKASGTAASVPLPTMPTGKTAMTATRSLPALKRAPPLPHGAHKKKKPPSRSPPSKARQALGRSPLAWGPESGAANTHGHNLLARRERERLKERENAARMARKPKLVQALSANGAPAKVKGHFCPGTVPSRPEHAVPRRLVLSEWLNPDKKTSLEAGLSKQALKALTPANELQGPTNWASVDLRLKYRSEEHRNKAWLASLEQEREAERLRQEGNIFISVTTISRHPIHVDFVLVVEEENREATRKARGRTRLKLFSYDLPVIWNANRPEDPAALLLDDSRESSEAYPPPFTGVNGIRDRRDWLAHESPDCQVQSVSPERARQGVAVVGPDPKEAMLKKRADSQAYFDSFHDKLRRVTQARITTVTRTKEDGSVFLERAKRQRRRRWKPTDAADFRMFLTVGHDGLLASLDAGVEGETGVPGESLIVSCYYLEEGAWAISAYSTLDSMEYTCEVETGLVESLMARRREDLCLEHANREELAASEAARRELEHNEAIQLALEEARADWWYSVSRAARTAYFGARDLPDDQFADLAGLTATEARSCIEAVAKRETEGRFAAPLAAIVHRQALRVPLVEGNTPTGVSTACLVIVSAATSTAEKEGAKGDVCIVINVTRLDTGAASALAFSDAALQRWMGTVGLSELVDPAPAANPRWWLLASEWKAQLLRCFLRHLCLEAAGTRAFVPDLAIAQAATHYQRMQAVQANEEARRGPARPIDPVPPFVEPTQADLMRHTLLAPSKLGGLGVVDCLWAARRVRLSRERSNTRRGTMMLAASETGEGIAPLALLVCGRRPSDPTYVGGPPPSMILIGCHSATPVLFARDKRRSSTNSVTCTLTQALDHPLLAPVSLAFNSEAMQPPRAVECLDLPEVTPAIVAPFVAKSVISKLDYREACTIVVLSAAAVELDLAEVSNKPGSRKSGVSHGHRRLEPEHTPHNFRVRVLARLEELCQPNPDIAAQVFGITHHSATTNAPDTWPHRYTWHSDDDVDGLLSRKRLASDFAYVSHRGATVGSNDPNGYISFMVVEVCRLLARISRTQQQREQSELEEREKNEEMDAVLRERLLAARASKERSKEERALLDQQLNDKRIARERRLRGMTAQTSGVGMRSEDWVARRSDPSTKRLGRWTCWQAYLFLDQQARAVVINAARQAELDQLARIAAGERPKSKNKLLEEAFDLAVKEGTLFYHNEVEDAYQWDQPEGWQGVATLPVAEEKDPLLHDLEKEEDTKRLEEDREKEKQRHPLRGDEEALGEDVVQLVSDYDPGRMVQRKDKELQEMRAEDARAALAAAKAVEHARRLRFVEENVRRWLDTKALGMDSTGAFDLRFVFREMDDARSGVLAYDEFRLGLANMELELPLADQDTIIKHLDPDGNKVVDYIEFVHWLVYTWPDSRDLWMVKSMDLPELGPNSWAKMRDKGTLVKTVALYEEFKDSSSGQHFYGSQTTGEFSWVMPDVFWNKSLQERDARELRQAQVAASMAAKAAAESAEMAERVSERSVGRLVEQLASSAEFVRMLAEELGLALPTTSAAADTATDTAADTAADSAADSATGVPPLKLERPHTAPKSASSGDGEDDESGSPRTPHSADSNDAGDDALKPKPGVEWRVLRPGQLQEGFITRASRPNTRGADMDVYSHNINKPSLVGVVDPADVSHLPFEDFPPLDAILISDIMNDTEANKEALLDRSEEEEMVELIHDAFLAAKSGNIEKIEEALDLGVKVTEADENGNTLFIIAAQQGNKRLVKFLLRRGANINAQNLVGNSALHYCFQYSFNSLAEYLIAKGADDSILNKDGLTCYEGLNAAQLEQL